MIYFQKGLSSHLSKNYIIFNFRDSLLGEERGQIDEIIGLENMVDTNKVGLRVTIYNGEIIPVIDPKSIFFVDDENYDENSKILITSYYNEKFGILVDGVVGIENITNEDLEKPSIKEMKFVKSIYKGIKLIDIKDFITEDFIQWSKGIRSNELDVVVNAEKTYPNSLDESEYIKKEISRELINLIIDKGSELNEEQIEKISSIQKKIEGLF